MYKLLFSFVLVMSFNILTEESLAKSSDSCDCPEVKCSNPCEESSGVSFYTEKCDGGKRVKSCAKPACVPMLEPNAACLAYKKENMARNIASQMLKKKMVPKYKLREEVAKVELVNGKAWVRPEASSAKKNLNKGMTLREADFVVTDDKSSVRIKFFDGNIVNILPNSELKLTKVDTSDMITKKTVLDLIKGKVRNKVKQKYKGADSFYRVRTRGAVAGVRGTDFVVSYEVAQKAVTKVQTLEGEVQLNSGDFAQKQSLTAGQEGSFIIAANDSEVFNEEEINDFVARGYMTPVYKLSANEMRKLDYGTSVSHERFKRSVASSKKKKDQICSQPKAQLNQCSWTCKNNPGGESRCRTDLPQVHCIRKRCNANGEWADDMRLPASYYEMCKPSGTKVAPCDY